MEGKLAMAGISRAYKRRGNMVANTGGPVLCLDAGSRISYPGSGTTWTDLSGNGNTGTLTNGPTYSSANSGSIVFDGVNDYVDCGSGATLDITSAITILAWVKPTSSVLHLGVVEKLHPSNIGDWAYHFGFYQGKIILQTGWPWAQGNTVLSNGIWYHIAVVYNKVNANFYLNGVSDGSPALSGGLLGAAQPVNVGRYPWASGSGYFPGLISSVSIYNRALSAAEISTNFNLLRGRYGI